MSPSLVEMPPIARTAWLRLRDQLRTILGDDLVAMWAHGGTTFPDRPRRRGDLDTTVILDGAVDRATCQRIARVQHDIGREENAEWDVWYLTADAARRAEMPRDACREDRSNASWAIDRAHWHAGQYVNLHGPEPGVIVPVPAWAEIEVALREELEHLERHVAAGEDNPFEATYAFFNGSRILHAVETGNVVISKRSAGAWALGHLPDRWHSALTAAARAYDAEATPEDTETLRTGMAPFVAMVGSAIGSSGGRT